MPPIGIERRERELACALLMRRSDGRPREGLVERPDDALAHLPRRLARERHRDDLLGALDPRQERQEALDQKLGLPRARGGLDQKRAAGIERALARRAVLREQRGGRGAPAVAALAGSAIAGLAVRSAVPLRRSCTTVAGRSAGTSRRRRAARPRRGPRAPPPPSRRACGASALRRRANRQARAAAARRVRPAVATLRRLPPVPPPSSPLAATAHRRAHAPAALRRKPAARASRARAAAPAARSSNQRDGDATRPVL